MLIIGIDPGTTTGLAIWDAKQRKLLYLESMKLHSAMTWVLGWATGTADAYQDTVVRLEDCRTLRMVGGENSKGARATGALQGVGSIKRDCTIWDDFLTERGVWWVSRLPQRSLTKWPADKFRKVTGWLEATNEHQRDAAMAIFGLNEPQCRAMLAEAQQRKPLKKKAADSGGFLGTRPQLS